MQACEDQLVVGLIIISTFKRICSLHLKLIKLAFLAKWLQGMVVITDHLIKLIIAWDEGCC